MERGLEETARKMRKANRYAKAALANPALRTHYEQLARQQDTTSFLAARGDYYRGVDLLSAN